MTTAFSDWSDILEEWTAAAAPADAQLYGDLARDARPPVVELGCGDGRLTEVIVPDTAIDFSPRMVERTKERVPDGVHVMHADIATYHLPTPASFTFAALNTINHIVDRDRRRLALSNVRRNTAADGLFAFDAFVPDLQEIKYRSGAMRVRYRTDRLVLQTALVQVSDDALDMHGSVDFLDAEGRVAERRYLPVLGLAIVAPGAYRRLLAETGWRPVDVWGDFDRTPLGPRSRTQIWLVTPA